MVIKEVVIYGDSISTKSHGNGGYEELLKNHLEIGEIHNHAISSSGISKSTPNNLVELLENDNNIHRNADLIVLWHGTNDWFWGAPLGDIESEDTTTFYGAVKHSIELLRKNCPEAIVLYLTPIFRYEIPNQCSVKKEGYVNCNARGLTLKDYYDAIVEMSVVYGFNVVDMRRQTNFHMHNAEKYLEDFVHPNAEGYKVISKVLVKAISDNFPRSIS